MNIEKHIEKSTKSLSKEEIARFWACWGICVMALLWLLGVVAIRMASCF